MSEFSKYQERHGPGFLQGPNGGAWGRALGEEKNYQLDTNRQAVLADIPRPTSTADELVYIGADRALPRAIGSYLGGLSPESDPANTQADAAYAERLRTCWDANDGHRFKGSHGGLLRALARAGFPVGLAVGAVLIQRTKRYSYLSDTVPGQVVFGVHSGWTFNPQGPDMFNQFGIMFGADLGNDPATGLPKLADGTQMAITLNALVREWKPAKARYMGAKVVVSGSIWGWPIGATWGQAGRNWGGVSRFIAP